MNTPSLARRLCAAAAVATALSVAAPAAAQSVNINTPHRGRRPLQLDLHAGFTWWGFGLATGARFGIPILENGFIDSINNAFYINFGGDFYFVRNNRRGGVDEYDPGFGIPVAAHWEFYFSDRWSVFAELGINIYFHPSFFRSNRDLFDHGHGGAWFLAAVGGRLHLNDVIALTLRLGNPYSAFGITFMI